MRYVVRIWKDNEQHFATKAVVTADSKPGAKSKVLDFISQYRTAHPEVVAPKGIQMDVLTFDEFVRTLPVKLRYRAQLQLQDLAEEIGDDVYIPSGDPGLGSRRWYTKHAM